MNGQAHSPQRILLLLFRHHRSPLLPCLFDRSSHRLIMKLIFRCRNGTERGNGPWNWSWDCIPYFSANHSSSFSHHNGLQIDFLPAFHSLPWSYLRASANRRIYPRRHLLSPPQLISSQAPIVCTCKCDLQLLIDIIRYNLGSLAVLCELGTDVALTQDNYYYYYLGGQICQ